MNIVRRSLTSRWLAVAALLALAPSCDAGPVDAAQDSPTEQETASLAHRRIERRLV